MTHIALIDDRALAARRFEAALHGLSLEGDEIRPGQAHNRSHAAMERMKRRRAQRGHE